MGWIGVDGGGWGLMAGIGKDEECWGGCIGVDSGDGW